MIDKIISTIVTFIISGALGYAVKTIKSYKEKLERQKQEQKKNENVQNQALVMMLQNSLTNTYFVYQKTPIRIRKWYEIVKPVVGALLFIPIVLILKSFLDGWKLVLVFVFTGGVVYLMVEAVLRNESLNMLKSLLFERIKIKR